MRNDVRIIDADGHVMEPRGMWERYIAPEFRRRAPRIEPGARLNVDGIIVPRVDGANRVSPAMWQSFKQRIEESVGEYHAAGYTAEAQLRAMDSAGVEIMFLFPTQGLYAASIDELDPGLAGAICAAYNDWVVEFAAAAPDRLRPVGMLVALHDPAAAVEEARRVARKGMPAVFVRPNPIRGKNLDDPAYEPLWTECERLGLAVAVHEGVGARLPTAGADRFTTFFGAHAASHPMEQMLALASFIGGGVLERHPRLRVAFLESGCGWLPYWLWRLDEHWEKTSGVDGEPRLPVRPSEYFRRQCWISCEPDEPYLPRVLDLIGEDRLLFAGDYPHPDHKWPETVARARALPIGERAKRKLLWDNPRAFYGVSA